MKFFKIIILRVNFIFRQNVLKATCFLSGLSFCSFIRMFTENDCFVYVNELNANFNASGNNYA